MASVDPKTAEFRSVHLDSLDALLREAERLAAAEGAGTLRATGNWSLGQTFGHVATWIDFAYDGYPPQVRPPWIIKVLLRTQKRKFLSGSLPRGVRIPKLEGGTLGIEPLSTQEGLRRLRSAVGRLRAGTPPHPNPIFGRLTHQEWTTGHLRHAELHFGYFHTT